MITVENIISHELVGLQTNITESTNSQILGRRGTIIDETKSMIILETKNGIKKFPKQGNIWQFSLNGQYVTINGNNLCKRPVERLRTKI